MYARYIPLSKDPGPVSGPKPPARPSSPAPTRTQHVPVAALAPVAAAAPADGYGYARYIPGARAVKKPTVQYFDDQASPPKSKRKREGPGEVQGGGELGAKKAKIKGGESGTNPAVIVGGGKKAPQQQLASKKKNRRKRKQRTLADNDDDSPDSGDEASKPALSERKKGEVSQPPGLPQEDNGTAEAKRKAEKSDSGKKRPKRQSLEVADNDVNMTDVKDAAQNAEVDSTTERASPAAKKKSKEKKRDKEKKKAKKDEVDIAADPQQLGDEPSRHKAVFERKAKSLQFARKAAQPAAAEPEEEPTELHGLEPLPQPAVVADDDSKPTYDTLPPWLANPIRVSQDTKKPFTELGIAARPARFLEKKGFVEAFAVQTAAIPLLLPSKTQRPGDVLISAATGSGKTLAYALPIVRDVGQGIVTRLRALVVLPTRELVKQAQEVFEICARAYDSEERKKVRIGVAVGHQSIKAEQHDLMASESRYDPDVYELLKEQGTRKAAQASESTDGDELMTLVADGAESKDPRLGAWEGEVVDYYSKVDVMICTPGRLVEHVEQTPGFSLDYVRWLVVDEADKLLAQSFQGWLDLVMERFKKTSFGARDFGDMEYSGVRKVVLSATLTRDLSLLNQLDLRRPRLVMLEDDGDVQVSEHTLPHSLKEFAVRVHETGLKPLYLLELLRSRDMAAAAEESCEMTSEQADTRDVAAESGAASDSDATSDSGATSRSGSSSGSSDTDGGARRGARPTRWSIPQCLIFTKSNESALRLARLLELLDPWLSTRISTLTSVTPTHIRRKTLRAFATAQSPVRLIVASDLVARGIDIPRLSHVINYDVPPSVASYVHRVGRTARAGRTGCAWTLVGDDESGWFWGRIAKGHGVRRAQKVARTRIEAFGEERTKQYEAALAALGKEALEMKRA